jgi:CRISPR-associated protein Cmr3
MSQTYLITLQPLEPFFFGGEYTFGADESRKESSRYSATSTQFPQQTALLGMLRKTMLIQNGHLTMHKKGEWVDSRGRGTQDHNYDNAKKLVGTEAFSYEKAIDLGVIEQISPLFIQTKERNYVVNAKDDGLKLKELAGAVSLGRGGQKAFFFENFDAKNHNHSAFVSTDNRRKNFSDFFEEVERVGIKKSQGGETENDAFFRKKSYYPKDGESFAFFATFSDSIVWEKESIVTLGADQSSFRLSIEETSTDFKKMFNESYEAQTNSRVVLASETLLSKEAYEACSFVYGSRQPYRQLTDAKHGKKSKRYYLLERGSVLYTEQLETLEKELNQAHLQTIGINHYFTIKGTKNV